MTFGRGIGFGVHNNKGGVSCFSDVSIGRRSNVLGGHSGSFFSCGGGVSIVHCTFRGGVGTCLDGSSGLSMELGIRLHSLHRPGHKVSSVFTSTVGSDPIRTPIFCRPSKAAGRIG